MYIHAYMCVFTCIHTCVHTCICACTCTHMCTNMCTYTHMHTCVNVWPVRFDGKKERRMIDPDGGLRVTVKCFLCLGCQTR